MDELSFEEIVDELEGRSLLKTIPPMAIWHDPKDSILIFNHGKKPIQIMTVVEVEDGKETQEGSEGEEA